MKQFFGAMMWNNCVRDGSVQTMEGGLENVKRSDMMDTVYDKAKDMMISKKEHQRLQEEDDQHAVLRDDDCHDMMKQHFGAMMWDNCVRDGSAQTTEDGLEDTKRSGNMMDAVYDKAKDMLISKKERMQDEDDQNTVLRVEDWSGACWDEIQIAIQTWTELFGVGVDEEAVVALEGDSLCFRRRSGSDKDSYEDEYSDDGSEDESDYTDTESDEGQLHSDFFQQHGSHAPTSSSSCVARPCCTEHFPRRQAAAAAPPCRLD